MTQDDNTSPPKRRPGRPHGSKKKLPENFSDVIEDIAKLSPVAVATLGKFVRGKVEGQSALDQRAAAIQVLKFMQDWEIQQNKVEGAVTKQDTTQNMEEGIKTPLIQTTAIQH